MEKNKKKKSGKKPVIAWSGISAVLLAGLIVGNRLAFMYSPIISTYLGQATDKIVETEGSGSEDTEYYKSEYKEKELVKAGEKLCQEIAAEGIVLLKNDNNVLPLGADKKVSLFSESSVDFVYGGTGSGAVDTSTAPTLKKAFESAGYEVNPTLWDFYKGNHRYFERDSQVLLGDSLTGSWKINECSYSNYTDEVKASYADYNDAAIVTISRIGGEGGDLASESTGEGNDHLLQLTTEEKELFEALENDSNFSEVIVIVNSSNPMELGWLNDYSKIHAAVWMGSAGQTGLYALADVFTGDVVPSGHLVDIYAADAKSSPAMQNAGHHAYTNASSYNLGDKYDDYVVYQEGIYVGYRYYETRYADAVMGSGNAGDFNYDEEVVYPFGYGLSYTTFGYDNFKLTDNGDSYTVSVDVTNTGDVAGKAVAQFYYQAPYISESGIERSAIELGGFDKSEDVITPGATVTLTADIEKEALKAYDYANAGTYVMQGGDYYFTVGEDSHNAVQNILAKQGYEVENGNADLADSVQIDEDLTTYATTSETGYEVINQFADADLNNKGISVTYLSRSDWENTFPTEQVIEANDEIVAEQAMKTAADIEATDEAMPTTGAENGMQAIMLVGKDYDDPDWDKLLDNLTFDEMQEIIRIGGYRTTGASSINMKTVGDQDGPAGISATLVGGGTKCMAYPSEIMLGASFNKSLAYEMGKLIGEDALHADSDGRSIVGWYAPSVNIHRTPFSGRNYEYYSEDGYMSGIFAANVMNGAEEKGAVCFLKHFAFNDQETDRMGISVWGNEQAFREIYLEPFEVALKNSNATALMSSMNRIGSVWTGASYNLLTEVLRNEWGFEGRVLSDYNGSTAYSVYQSIYGALEAGNDQMLNTSTSLYQLTDGQNNAAVVNLMRKACHNILYSVINSAAMNGISTNVMVVSITPQWQYWLMIFDGVVGVLIVVSGILVFRNYRKSKNTIEIEE